MTAEEIRRFLEEPGAHLILNPDLTILDVGPEYLRVTMTKRGEIIGKSIFDVFPDNPEWKGADGVKNLRASLERVRGTLEPDKMPVQRYDIRDHDSEFVERWWRPANIPVIRNDELRLIIHRVEDVTQQVISERQINAIRRSNYILYALTMVMITFSVWFAVRSDHRIASDARQTCLVQKHGLPIGHELAASLDDIHRLLTVKPTTRAQRLAVSQTPKAVKAIVADLNAHLAAYQRDEARQPRTRIC